MVLFRSVRNHRVSQADRGCGLGLESGVRSRRRIAETGFWREVQSS